MFQSSRRAGPSVPRIVFLRFEASLFHQLRSGLVLTDVNLAKIGRLHDSIYLGCGDLEDSEHVLLHCSDHVPERNHVFSGLRGDGRPHVSVID